LKKGYNILLLDGTALVLSMYNFSHTNKFRQPNPLVFSIKI